MMQLKDLQAMPVDNSSDGAVAGWSTISNHCNNTTKMYLLTFKCLLDAGHNFDSKRASRLKQK